MALIIWTEEYSVGIAEIDSQHMKLVGLINRLHTSILSKTGKEALSGILNDLVYYTVYHFETEEHYFDEYDYPGSEQHKSEHKQLIEQVAELQKRHDAGEKMLTMDVMNFLKDWLHEHILGSDKKYGPYLNEKGII